MSKRTGDPITLGSGKLYHEEFNDLAELTFDFVRSLCVAEKRLALIKSGASLEYTEETYTEKDDLGIVSKTVTTEEEVKLKGGLLTWTGNTLNVLVDRSKVTESEGFETMETRDALASAYMVKIDPEKYSLRANQLAGRWVRIGDQRAYVGSNSKDMLLLYTDSINSEPMYVTCEAGAVIYPDDGRPLVDSIRTTKIGGAGNAKNKYYVLVFHHEDKQDGDLWVAIVGRNTAGLSLTFAPDAGTLVEPEFTAKPHDEDGTLVVLYEEL